MTLTPTTGKQWRSGKPIQLPSGNVPMLRKPNLLKVVRDQNAPDFITSTLLAGLRGESVSVDTNTPDALRSMDEALDWVCKQCFVNPRIVEAPQADDEISLDDVTYQDKMAVLQWAMGQEGADANSFRQEQGESVGAVADSESVQPASQPVG